MELESILKDFPPGPLDEYRQSASFRWQDMILLLNSTDQLILKVTMSHSTIFSY